MIRLVLLALSHGAALALGFGLGVYFLPILTAPPAPDAAMLQQQAQGARFTATLTRDLRGSDLLHWGEGTISLSDTRIVHEGRLAPGPDYRLYLVPGFVDHEDTFAALRQDALMVGAIDGFAGFVLDLPPDVDLTRYTSVLIWCEAFGEFITAGQYRQPGTP